MKDSDENKKTEHLLPIINYTTNTVEKNYR